MPESALKNSKVSFENLHPTHAATQSEVIDGLQQPQKMLNPKFFYDTYGSELFEQITQLPEYYPTRTERSIFSENSAEIAEYCGQGNVVVEPGSGSSEKVRLLLDALSPSCYVPMDIAADFLLEASERLSEEFPWLNIHALCADFNQLEGLPDALADDHKTIFYPGSTIGNMEPAQAEQFLRLMRPWLKGDGNMLIGVDLVKAPPILNAAYNDAQGVTAKFNLNALTHINASLNADFDTRNFIHQAFFNETLSRIEMHLQSTTKQTVSVGSTQISFEANETIHTENSYKYSIDSFKAMTVRAGLEVKRVWTDYANLFGVFYLEEA